jgi:hypothetical protein
MASVILSFLPNHLQVLSKAFLFLINYKVCVAKIAIIFDNTLENSSKNGKMKHGYTKKETILVVWVLGDGYSSYS